MPNDRFVRLELFEKHSKKILQTNRLTAGVDLDNSNAQNVIMYLRMETKFDRLKDPNQALKTARKNEEIESGRLWLSREEFLQLASLMIHVGELFKTTYRKGTKESGEKMRTFKKAWKKLKEETWE